MKTIGATKTNARKTITRRNAIRLASLLFAGALVSCVSLELVTRAHNAKSSVPETPVVAAPAAATQGGPSTHLGPLQVVQFTLYDVGIYPREMHISKGLIALSIEDLSGGSRGLVIERETGNAPEQVGHVERSSNSLRARSEIDLGPGKYQVYMADRPDNRAVLIVEP